MGELRSSWEIAREKAGRLGNLSTEERKQQREASYRGAALAVVKEYFDGRNIRYMERELNKYTGDDRELMRKMLLDCLVEAIDVNEKSSLDSVFIGITALYSGAQVKACLDEIRVLYKEYRDTREKEEHHIEDEARKMLREKGISGSAVRVVDIDAGSERSGPLDDSAVSFRKKLAAVREKIVK
jgi:hypothetical protein